MNRRGFFKALAAATAIAVVSTTRLGQAVIDVARSGYHVLVGDGVTDDTAALQALLDGEPVISPTGALLPGKGTEHVPSGYTYRISETLVVSGPVVLRGLRINYHYHEIGDAKPFLLLKDSQFIQGGYSGVSVIEDCQFFRKTYPASYMTGAA
jgi:hypothetical protein